MFHTTLWSDLNDAAAGREQAIEAFVARYRPPVLVYLRRQGASESDAEDLAQEVFVRLFSQRALERAEPAKGRFRTYLLGLTHNVLLEHWRRARAEKRGGAVDHVPFDLAAHDLSAEPEEATFERCWQEHVLELALAQVGEEHARQHDLLVRTARGEAPAQIAQATQREVGAVRVDLHRARKRLAEAVRAVIAGSVTSREEYDEEVKRLLTQLPGGAA